MHSEYSRSTEIRALLEAVHMTYGYDFRKYAEASLTRRILRNLAFSGYQSIPELQNHVLRSRLHFENLLTDLSINVTDMFRDPQFYKSFRKIVIPELKQMPYIKIWHAGCASGEEVYSMAALFSEEGLNHKTRVFATDFNEKVLAVAKEGLYPLEKMKDFTTNYYLAGGQSSFSDYYTVKQHRAEICPSLKNNITFARHNLVSDGSFGEMQVILCRNVLIYFKMDLQDRVFQLFRESLYDGGYLCLGSKESLKYSSCAEDFDTIASLDKIYRKKRNDRSDD
jgi:chemotaxis protein methyltransferase CheR